MQEFRFLIMTNCLNVHYKCMKFRWNIFDGYQVIERHDFVTDRPTNRGKGKNINAIDMVLVCDTLSEYALQIYKDSLKYR